MSDTPKGRVLVIAGSDSGGGAGIQADIKTITALGGYAATAITAVTVQNTLGVTGVHPIPLHVIAAHHPSVPDGLAEVLIYNLFWFALPIGALAVCVFDPPAAQRPVDTIRTGALRHAHTLLLTVSLVAGTGLVIRGLITV